MKIYMIRHGETDWNRELRLQGREDVPLNAAGKIQAAVCGDALKGLGIQAVFTSPLSRARLTGEILAGRIGLDPGAVLAMDGLIERDLGEFSGKLIKDRQEYFSVSAGQDSCGMEPFEQVGIRMLRALSDLSKSGFSSVAAVSHGAAINVLLARLSNHTLGTGKTKLLNGGISLLEGSADEGFSITVCNASPDEFRRIVSPWRP